MYVTVRCTAKILPNYLKNSEKKYKLLKINILNFLALNNC